MFLDFLTGAAGGRGLAGPVEVFIEPPIKALPTSKQRIRTELPLREAVSVRILCLGARRAALRRRLHAMVRTDGERSPYMTNVRSISRNKVPALSAE